MDGNKYLKFNLKNKITASLISFLVIILSLTYFIILPTVKEIKAMGIAIAAEREDLEKKYIKGQSLKQLTENLKKIETRLKLLDQIFINKNRELEFITSLENEANKSQVSQKINLNAPQPEKNQNFQKTVLELRTKGNFIKQLKYLSNLEHLNYYINVKLLELSPASGDEQTKTGNQGLPADVEETNSLNMYLDADTYWN